MHNAHVRHHEVVITNVIVWLEISRRVNGTLGHLPRAHLLTNLSVQQHNACRQVESGALKYSHRFIDANHGENLFPHA